MLNMKLGFDTIKLLSFGEVAGTCSGAVKCVDIARNTDGVGRQLAKY